MGATKIMVIRHAEKPGTYNGQAHDGVDETGTTCGTSGAKSLVTIGWQRAGGLITLFAPPWGPKAPTLGMPEHIYAADPGSGGETPSRRPFETVIPVAAMLGVRIDARHKKDAFAKVVTDALGKEGVVLICWQHELIGSIGQCILTGTSTTAPFGIPETWPNGPHGARYDLVWVFDRPSGIGAITGFTQFAQMLLPGDAAAPLG
ncbi:MAG: hypothetical protein QOD93_5566 [Acetobacteraceae bacterium]|jgi:hypothetical protein|nr:hypothetical protein [Acetobacteraceae bacterium]